jgi:hypothetical protein
MMVPPAFDGSVSVIDRGPDSNQVLASGIHASDIPAGGLPIVFEPSADFAGPHKIVAFLSNSQGVPERTLVLSTFTSPPLPKPSKPKIVKIVRAGTSVQVYFQPGTAPVSNGFGFALATGAGQTIEETVSPGELTPVGPMSGIGAAAQAGEYMVTIPNVDPTQTINLGVDGINEGLLGDTAVGSMGPGLRGLHAAADVGASGS